MAIAPGVINLSDRDLPLAMAQGVDEATPVAATITLAALAGIFVVATGGLGAVHLGARRAGMSPPTGWRCAVSQWRWWRPGSSRCRTWPRHWSIWRPWEFSLISFYGPNS